MSLSSTVSELVFNAIDEQSLPIEFVDIVTQYYCPLSQAISESLNNSVNTPDFIGIQGSQGSGKSTCASFLKLLLEAKYGLRVVATSIDDFYLTLTERQVMAKEVHSLFATRGVPGTHDVKLLMTMFEDAKKGTGFTVPIFDKAEDDRVPSSQWQRVNGKVDVVILEGWCVGIGAQSEESLLVPINELEKSEDGDVVWRRYVNQALSNEYKELFAALDLLISLQAPSFDCVLGWRQLQEEKMIAKLTALGRSTSLAQTPKQIERFISHYQRLTEHALATMPQKADYILKLNEDHLFTELLTVSK